MEICIKTLIQYLIMNSSLHGCTSKIIIINTEIPIRSLFTNSPISSSLFLILLYVSINCSPHSCMTRMLVCTSWAKAFDVTLIHIWSGTLKPRKQTVFQDHFIAGYTDMKHKGDEYGYFPVGSFTRKKFSGQSYILPTIINIMIHY